MNLNFYFFNKIGATIKIVTDDQYKEKCTKDILWVDYKNISKVLVPGARIFIDDGLISVIAKECGPDYVIGEIENHTDLFLETVQVGHHHPPRNQSGFRVLWCLGQWPRKDGDLSLENISQQQL